MGRSRFSAPLLIVAALSASSVSANDREYTRAIENMLNLYARNAGVLARCHEGPGEAGVEREADTIARWKHPGILAQVGGQRTSYKNKILSSARSSFYSARWGAECPGPMFIGTYKGMLETASRSIEQYTQD